MNRYIVSRVALTAALLFFVGLSSAAASGTIYPAADRSLLSPDFTMQIGGHDVPVYLLKVAPEDASGRNSAMDDKIDTANYFDRAAFTYFDTAAGINATITYKAPVNAARLLPASANGRVSFSEQTIQLSLGGPGNYTLEVNHQLVRTLHIFANPVERDAPSPHAANVFYLAPGAHLGNSLNVPATATVIYFAPGMHTIDNLVLHDGQTVYIAGGAVVSIVISDAEPFSTNMSSNGIQKTRLYKQPGIKVQGSNITVRGRGVLDGSHTAGKYLMRIQGQNIRLEGIILQDAGTWTMPMLYSNGVTVTNLKLLGYRANSDGMDIVSSQNVTIEGCFIRTLDDDIVIKTITQDPNAKTETDEARNIQVRGNVIWSEVAHALTIGTQVEAYVNTISFIDNDIIHHLGRTEAMSIDLEGSGDAGNVRFEDIRLDTSRNPYDKNGVSRDIALMTTKNKVWQRATDLERPLGHVHGVTFSNVQITSTTSPKVQIRLLGTDDQSNIQDVKFERVTFNGRPLSKADAVVQQRFANHVVGLP